MATPPDFSVYIAPITGADGALAGLASTSTGIPKVLKDLLPLPLGIMAFMFAWRRLRAGLRGK